MYITLETFRINFFIIFNCKEIMVKFDDLIREVREPEEGSLFLTVTLSPKLYKHHPKLQFYKTHGIVADIMDRFCTDYCRITELTEDGNLHYHAWITLKNPNHRVRFLCTFKEKRYQYKLGYAKLNKEPIVDTMRVYNYMLGRSISDDKDKTGKDLKEACSIIDNIYCVYNFTSLLNTVPIESHIEYINSLKLVTDNIKEYL